MMFASAQGKGGCKMVHVMLSVLLIQAMLVDNVRGGRNDKGNWMNVLYGVGAVVGGGAIAIVAAPAVVTGLGFGTAGIAVNTIAASMMSSAAIANGGGVVAGALVATLQTIGATGVLTTGAAAVSGVAGGAAGGGAYYYSQGS